MYQLNDEHIFIVGAWLDSLEKEFYGDDFLLKILNIKNDCEQNNMELSDQFVRLNS